MASNTFRKKQEHKMKVKLKKNGEKLSGAIGRAVDRVDAMVDLDIAQMRNQ